MIINLDEDFEACSLATKIRGKVVGFCLDGERVVPTPTARYWYDQTRYKA